MQATLRKTLHALLHESRSAITASTSPEGFPETKAMFLREYDGKKTFWFSSNVSARSTGQWAVRPQASVYLYNPETVTAVLFTGHMRVREDLETKKAFWQEGDEQYYPAGPSDPDYCMLEFVAGQARIYHWDLKLKDYSMDAFVRAMAEA